MSSVSFFKNSSHVAFAIIAVATTFAITSVWNDSLAVDEVPHIGAGYSYLVKRDMRLNPEHPPLAKDLAAIPLLFLNLRHDVFNNKNWTTDVNGQWEFGRELIYHSDGVDAQLITRLAKLPMLLFFIAAAWIVFIWTRKLYGNKSSLIALILFSFSPTILAHSRLVTTDMPALFGILSATYFFLNYLSAPGGPSRKAFWLAVLFFGIAMCLKFSTVLLIPFFILIGIKKSFRSTVYIIIAGFIFIVFPVYTLHTIGYPIARQHADTVQLLAPNDSALKPLVIWASDKPVIRAGAQYALGLLLVQQRATGGNFVYFNGEIHDKTAGLSYFPFVYLIKEPLAWLALLSIAIISLALKLKAKSDKLKAEEYAMLLWLAIYWIVSIQSRLNIGIRHLLPVYPFMIILVSGQIQNVNLKMQNYNLKFKKFTLSFSTLIFALCIWYVVKNIKTFPYYLTYFNRKDGYKYVVDSNLDWGQDLKRLSDWVKENKIEKIQLDYFGWADQSYYLGNNFIWLTSKQRPASGWFAVSATYLQNHIHDDYAWLAGRKPDAVIGNSIFVYHL